MSAFCINKFCSWASPNKKSRKDPLIEVVVDIGSSLKEYCSFVKDYFTVKKNKKSQLSGEEIYVVVSKVPGLMQLEIFKIVEKVMHGNPEGFKFLKSLSNYDDKKDWIQLLLSPH